MPSSTGSNNPRRLDQVVSIRLTAMEFEHLRVMSRMAGCRSSSAFLRHLFEHAHEQAMRDLQRF